MVFAMFGGFRSISVLLLVAGCGASIPDHSGYKSDKVKPWKKPKLVTLDAKLEAKIEGSVDYPDRRRARWYALDLPSSGELTLELEISPATESEDFDLSMEVIDARSRVLAKADLEEEDAHELVKTRTLYELPAGRYLIHLYLQRRIDAADFDLKLSFRQVALQSSSDFAARVSFPPRLAVVPLRDDGPGRPERKPRPRSDEPKPDADQLITAKIINVVVSAGGTQITIGRGTDAGLAEGMAGRVQGIKQGSFVLSSCGTRSCKATVKATSDEVSRAGKVVVTR
jgi:hypothetical protein